VTLGEMTGLVPTPGGLPVLATRVSGSVDFVEPGSNGWLVDSDNRQQLAEKLREVAALDSDSLARLGENARQRVVAKARIDAVSTKLAALYEIDAALLKHLPHREYG
jgi:glycosyltransferase involved in cell wall biosynthesis